MTPTTYELDAHGEASGVVHHYCSNVCQNEHAFTIWQREAIRMHVTQEPDAAVRSDMCDGEVCANCETVL